MPRAAVDRCGLLKDAGSEWADLVIRRQHHATDGALDFELGYRGSGIPSGAITAVVTDYYRFQLRGDLFFGDIF